MQFYSVALQCCLAWIKTDVTFITQVYVHCILCQYEWETVNSDHMLASAGVALRVSLAANSWLDHTGESPFWVCQSHLWGPAQQPQRAAKLVGSLSFDQHSLLQYMYSKYPVKCLFNVNILFCDSNLPFVSLTLPNSSNHSPLQDTFVLSSVKEIVF